EIKLLKDPAKSLFNDTDHIDAIELLAGNVKQSLNAQLEKFTQVNSKSKIVKDSQYVISDREKAIDKLDKYIRIQLTEEAKKAVEELTEEKIKEVYNKLVPIFTKKEYISGLIARAKRDVALDSTKNVKDYVIELFKKDVDEELKKIIVTAPAGTAVVTPPPAAGSPPGATGTTTPTTPIPFDPNAIKNSAKDKLIEKLSPHIIRLATAETRDESVKTMIKDIKEKFDKLIKTESSLAAFKPGEIGTLAKKIRIRISNVRHIIVNEPSLANRNTLIASFNADVVKHMQEYYINYDSKRNRDDILKRIEKWIPDLKEIQQAQGEATP
ncbi:hypothetical protein J4206_05230, partial [Candidatus Woesearchaeota archaeon]|nr:hypothetical protein [Candidatus Woesearchaeota archaeon]